jgi:hypothetical protein
MEIRDGGTSMSLQDQQGRAPLRAHTTPDPDLPPPDPRPDPDDVPAPARAPVEEPDQPQPPVKAE